MKNILLYALTSLSFYFIIDYMIRKYFKGNNDGFIRYSQSDIHSIIKDYIPKPTKIKPAIETQSTKHESKNNVKVIIAEDRAYWVMHNSFYTADVIDGHINKESTQVIDTFSLDKEELDKMLFIIDQLKNGN